MKTEQQTRTVHINPAKLATAIADTKLGVELAFGEKAPDQSHLDCLTAQHLSPEAAAQRYHGLCDSNPPAAVAFAMQYENDCESEQDYDDYLTACDYLRKYGVC